MTRIIVYASINLPDDMPEVEQELFLVDFRRDLEEMIVDDYGIEQTEVLGIVKLEKK